MIGYFQTHTMTLKTSAGAVRATGLACQLDEVNFPFIMEARRTIPTDHFDVYSIDWTEPVPNRTDYLVDEATGTKYSMFSTVFSGPNTLQFRVSKPSGSTP